MNTRNGSLCRHALAARWLQAGALGAGRRRWPPPARLNWGAVTRPAATACRNLPRRPGPKARSDRILAGRGIETPRRSCKPSASPGGIMPAFVESQMSDQQAADLAAYFWQPPEGSPSLANGGSRSRPARRPAQGRADQCRVRPSATASNLDGPRARTWAPSTPDFDYFAKTWSTNHTTRAAASTGRCFAKQTPPTSTWANYSKTPALSEGIMLRQIYYWARDEIGFPRARARAAFAKGETGPDRPSTYGGHRPRNGGHRRPKA